MNRTLGYVRVSSGKQIDNFSIPAQERVILEYCEKEGYSNVEIIRDEGKTARNMNRKGIKQIRDMIRAGAVKRVLITEPSRMNRDVKDLNILIEECNEYDVDLIGVLVPIDTKTPEGRLTTNIKGAVDQYDSEQKSVKSRSGLVQKGLQGEYPHGNEVPCGFRKNKKHYLVAVDREIEIIQKLFEYYVYDNLSEKNAAKKIEKETGQSFSNKNIYRFLAKPLFRGFVIVDDTEIKLKCEYLESCDEVELNKFMLSTTQPETELKPIINDEMYEDFLSRKKVKEYSKQTYKYRNKVYINGEKSQHCKQKNRNGKEYWYYYIIENGKKIHINQNQISEIKYQEFSDFSSNISTLSKGYVNGSLNEEEFLKKLNAYRRHFERLHEPIDKVPN